MKQYTIYKFDGKIRFVGTYKNRTKADKVASEQKYADNIMLIKTEVSDNEDRFQVFNVLAYLKGDYIKRYVYMPTIGDLYDLQDTLPVVYRIDGSMYFLPNKSLTTPKAKEIVGGWFHIKAVSDNPTMSIVFRDVDLTPKDKRPPINSRASEIFCLELYGDVIYINDNYVQ